MISPFTVSPNPDAAATLRIREPSAEVVAAVFLFTVIPVGKPLTVTEQAFLAVPWYPANGIVIVIAAEVFPSMSQGIVTASWPMITFVAAVPAPPVAPVFAIA